MINGKQIFSSGCIRVHECTDGYIICNGKDVHITSFMPLLDETSLLQMFAPDTDNYKRFQLARFGNVVKETVANESSNIDAFTRWYEKEAELEEMHTLGY
ncbi:MAG: hypothetical protein QM791_06165 [Ferruginibacter sp.]